MRRRALLVAFSTAAGVSGCTGILGDSDDGDRGTNGSTQDPTATVEAFYAAALAGDAKAARSYFHPSPELPPPSDAAIRRIANSTLRVENATVVDRSQSTATVRVTVSQERARSGARRTSTIAFELRQSDGEWLLYAQPLPELDDIAPTVEWEIAARRDDDRVTAVEFVHTGGDDLALSSLVVEIGGFTMRPGSASGDLAPGDVVRASFGTDEPTVPAGEIVEVVWTGSGSTTLGTYELDAATTGQPASTFEVDG